MADSIDSRHPQNFIDDEYDSTILPPLPDNIVTTISLYDSTPITSRTHTHVFTLTYTCKLQLTIQLIQLNNSIYLYITNTNQYNNLCCIIYNNKMNDTTMAQQYTSTMIYCNNSDNDAVEQQSIYVGTRLIRQHNHDNAGHRIINVMYVSYNISDVQNNQNESNSNDVLNAWLIKQLINKLNELMV